MSQLIFYEFITVYEKWENLLLTKYTNNNKQNHLSNIA